MAIDVSNGRVGCQTEVVISCNMKRIDEKFSRLNPFVFGIANLTRLGVDVNACRRRPHYVPLPCQAVVITLFQRRTNWQGVDVCSFESDDHENVGIALGILSQFKKIGVVITFGLAAAMFVSAVGRFRLMSLSRIATADMYAWPLEFRVHKKSQTWIPRDCSFNLSRFDVILLI